LVTSTRSLFQDFVKGLAEQLAGYGFERGTGGRVFRRSSPDGDVVIVELQSSQSSTRAAKVFFINVAFVLAAAWESNRRRSGRPASELPRTVHGIRFHRIVPDRAAETWQIEDRATLTTVSREVRRRVDETLPEYLTMLDRDTLFVDASEIFSAGGPRVRAWLLAGNGPSEELERLLSGCNTDVAEWIRDYSRTRPQSRPEPESHKVVRGRVSEDDLVPLMRRISGHICYAYDELDEVAFTSVEAGFRYPLMGMPPLTVHLARSAGSRDFDVRVEGPMKQILATRIGALL
jgi:hypothetical protein